MNDDDIGDAVELFESSYYLTLSHDSETGSTSITKSEPPKFRNIRRLKQASPDYRAGPVKIWSDEEIKAYTDSLKEHEDARSKELS